MPSKTEIVRTRIHLDTKARLTQILNRLGLSESQYIRGAIQAQLRVDERANQND